MQARDCLAADGWCMSGLSCAEIHRNAPISLCWHLFLKCVPSPKSCWFFVLLQQRAGKGHSNVIHKYMHASILVPPITHTEAWWPRSRNAQLNMGWMHMKLQLKPNSIMDNPECRWLGNWDTFRHSEYEMYLVSCARVNSYSGHDALCMTCMKCN